MNWKTIFNPFARFTEKQLLVVGLFFMILTGFVCFYTQTFMNSIFHFATTENLSLKTAFYYVVFCCFTAILFLFVLALFFNKKTRIIDIVNTVLISQAPNFIILLITKFSGLDEISKSIKNSVETNEIASISMDIPLLMLLILPILVFAVYGMILIFNGFKTATNFKKPQHITVFIISLLFFILFHQIFMQRVDL